MVDEILRPSELATPERALQEGGVVLEPAARSLIGKLMQVRHRARYADLIEKLAYTGMLGSGRDRQDRQEAAYRLKALWHEFNGQRSSLPAPSKGSLSVGYVSEPGDGEDLAETRYHKVMGMVPHQYRTTIRRICIDDIPPAAGQFGLKATITDALDALYGAFIRLQDE